MILPGFGSLLSLPRWVLLLGLLSLASACSRPSGGAPAQTASGKSAQTQPAADKTPAHPDRSTKGEAGVNDADKAGGLNPTDGDSAAPQDTQVAKDEPKVDQSDAAQTADNEPAADETAAAEPATDETATDETATDETATDETATDETATDETATDETATDETTAEDTAATEDSEPAQDDGAVDETAQDNDAKQDDSDDDDAPAHPFPRRLRAPELTGGVGWINTNGPLKLADLKGKFVVLDFWTYCCINCMHILPELKKLEAAYPNELVVIGVHSAKFENEEDSKNIREAVLRYEIEHPVVNDAHHAIWDKYGVNSWPTVLLLDPEGNAVWGKGGEVEFKTLDAVLKLGLPYYRRKGLLDETPLRFDLEAYQAEPTPLRFPGKVLADEAGDRLFIADSNHNRIVVTRLDGTLLETIGSGLLGAAEGGFAEASFDHPQGMALKDETLYVADTENHLLRTVDLKEKRVATIAGLGEQGRNAWPGLDPEDFDVGGQVALPERWVGEPMKTGLNSPWDLWIHGGDLFIAMAGPHQIWKMPLDQSEIGPYAGNGREDIVDGPLLPKEPYDTGFSSFAQPSGLSSDGEWLYVADSEGSSVRAVPFDPSGEVRTVIGTAHLGGGRLFQFGDKDGKGEDVRLQHCLGVCWHDGLLYITDTYNNKVKVIDPREETCQTLVGTGKPGLADDPAQFDEPAGISVAAGKLYIADTNNHCIRTVDLEQGNRVSTLEIAGLSPPAEPEPAPVAPLAGGKQVELPDAAVKPKDGKLHLQVALALPEGYKINHLAPMRYQVESRSDAGPVAEEALGKPHRVEPPSAEFVIELPVSAEQGEQSLAVTLQYYYCQDGAEGLCKAGSVTWTVPVQLSADAKLSTVPLKFAVE